jgi:hypothetical protein
MRVLVEAAQALPQNARAAAVYVLLCTGTNALKRTTDAVLASESVPLLVPSAQSAYDFAMSLFIAVGFTLASVLGFSRLARQLGRPLWKVDGDGEALSRFFMPWLLLCLAMVTTIRLMSQFLQEQPDSVPGELLKFVFFSLFIFSVPVGACIMFSGHFAWRDLPGSLAPLVRQFPLTLAVAFVNFIALVYVLSLPDVLRQWPGLDKATWFECLADAPLSLVDCYVFAVTWFICTRDRREMEERNRTGDYNF